MYRLTPLAEADLLSIGRHTERKWGTLQRRRYLAQLDTAFSTLAENSELGMQRDDIRHGIRSFVVASHVVWYRISTADIEILRILHQAMEPENYI